MNYKADVVQKIGDCPQSASAEEKARVMSFCRELIVAAWVSATRVQAAMRGMAARKAAAKKKKGKKKKK